VQRKQQVQQLSVGRLKRETENMSIRVGDNGIRHKMDVELMFEYIAVGFWIVGRAMKDGLEGGKVTGGY
jgi:hypothetical protein